MHQLTPTTYKDYPYQDESYAIIGASKEVHKQLGKSFLEYVYKGALQYEFKNFEREKSLGLSIKDTVLEHCYIVDFVIGNKIILEVKAQDGAIETHYSQVINYLAVTNLKLGLLVNFGEESLIYRRLVLNIK